MNSLIYLFRFLYRIRFWLIFCPLAVALIVIVKTRSLSRQYEVKTTVYTGIVSGYDIESSEGTKQDWNIINNAMDNLVNIITSQTTLKRVSMRLYAQHLMHGDPKHDNNYLTARTYRILLSRTPKDVLALVDKTSEEKTLDNLYRYEQASSDNHVYGLFNWTHRHYSYEALSKIKVKRMGSSDMLEVSYSADDPGVAYNTLVLLNEEFVKLYQELRFGETNNVIQYFEAELARTGKLLRTAEDSLTDYNVANRVINYDEQTKHIAALSRDFELRYEDILLSEQSSAKLIGTLEERIGEHVKNLKNNSLFIQKLNQIADLTTRIATVESFQSDTLQARGSVLGDARRGTESGAAGRLKQQRDQAQKELSELTVKLGNQYYTKEGLSTETLVPQWLDVLIRHQKATAELKVMEERKRQLDQQYVFFSPIGSTIKRKEREIGFTEQSYLSILHSLNAARLRQKSLQMTSATLKIINPPTFPIAAVPTKRKLMVAAAFFGTFLFVLGYFILLELLDRTLRDKLRTERLTSGKVLGAFPAPGRLRMRSYNKAIREICAQYMGNAVVNYFGRPGPNVVNLLSTEPGTGKSFLGAQLKEYLEKLDLKVRYVSYHLDFCPQRKNYLLAARIEEFIPRWDDAPDEAMSEDVILVEHPSLSECPVPKAVIRGAAVNLLVARADRAWKETDQLLFDKLRTQAGGAPLTIYLNMARREATEYFTGMLPPYSRLKRFFYRLYQFGIFSSGK